MQGLGLGADDYIVKPFEILELLARVEAVLRRVHAGAEVFDLGDCHEMCIRDSSCMMELDAAGRVVDYAFVKSVIRSRVKGVYKEVNAIFDGTADNALRQRYAAVAQELSLMRELYHKLAKLRAARGAMDIESGEAKLVLDEAGRCVDVVKRERGEAEQMIEEFMRCV